MNGRVTTLASAIALAGLTALLSGCGDAAYRMIGPYRNHIMNGDANGLMIQYVGDLNATVPLAKSHCAQYEKVPVEFSHADDKVSYLCIKPDAAPGQVRGELNSKLTLITDLLPAISR